MFCMCWIHAWICPVARSHIYQTDWKTLRVLTLSYTKSSTRKAPSTAPCQQHQGWHHGARLTLWKTTFIVFALGSECSLHTWGFSQTKPLSWAFCSTSKWIRTCMEWKHFTIETWGWQYVCVAKSKSCTGARTCSQEKLATCMANLIPEDLHTELCKHNCSACMF